MNRKLPSDAEVAVLEALAAQGETLTAPASGNMMVFRAPLLFVDPGREFLVIARSGDDEVDSAFFAQSQVYFFHEWGDWRIVFTADAPEPLVFEGLAAIRLRFPESVLINRRRMHERVSVSEEEAPRCLCVSPDSPNFDALIMDVGRGGIGMRIDNDSDELAPGMILRGCRIERRGRRPAIVDLEVTHTAAILIAGGKRALRIGCRFAYLSAEAMQFVSDYVRLYPGER